MYRTLGGGLNRSGHLMQNLKIPEYPTPRELETVLDIDDTSELSRKSQMYSKILESLDPLKYVDLAESHYGQLLKLALYLEEYQTNEEMKRHKMFNQTIEKVEEELSFSIHVKELDEESVWIRQNDFVDVTDTRTNVTYHLRVSEVKKSNVVASEDSPSLSLVFDPKNLYNINFRFQNYPLKCTHFALEITHKENVITYLFPHKSKPFIKMESRSYEDLTILNPNIETNPEQKQAVIHIVNKSSFPAPYILYGPPGTGKTATLIEAICQIKKASSSNRILVCTPSNTAADEVAKRLLKFLDACDIYRIYSQSRDRSTIDEELRSCCFCGRENSKIPLRREDINGKSVLISTNSTAIRFVQMQLNSAYFSHIIIDEAGQGTEPQMLVPISIASKNGELYSQVVLAGDPQQLGPTVISKLADKILGRSILERLMSYDTYRKDSYNNYNPKYITKLLHNYRSHPRIIQISNKLFYDDELVAKFSTDDETAKFPVIFHGVEGVENKVSWSPSTFNYKEIRMVLKYVYDLMDNKTEFGEVSGKDIGIVTPFKLQSKKIKKKLKKIDAEERRKLKEQAFENVRLLEKGDEYELSANDAIGIGTHDDKSEVENSDDDSQDERNVLENEDEKGDRKLGAEGDTNKNEKHVEIESDDDDDDDDQTKRRRFRDINVGTVELFQGQERKIMIMTAVRSKTTICNGKEHIGFVSNPKRFNVAMSRAQNALIVVGNPKILQKDGMWQYLIKYCIENGSYRGLEFEMQTSGDEKIRSLESQNVVSTAILFQEKPFKLFQLHAFDSTEDISRTVDLFVEPDKNEVREQRALDALLRLDLSKNEQFLFF